MKTARDYANRKMSLLIEAAHDPELLQTLDEVFWNSVERCSIGWHFDAGTEIGVRYKLQQMFGDNPSIPPSAKRFLGIAEAAA